MLETDNDNLMLDRVRASLQARLEGRADGGDAEVMRLVDMLVKQALDEREAPAPPRHLKPVDGLTRRQTQVLALLGRGHKNSDIAAMLDVSTKTVEWHKTAIKRELDLHTNTDLVRFAAEKGLSLEDSPPETS